MASLGIKVKVIEPGGAPQTGFLNRVGGESTGLQLINDYLPFLEQTGKMFQSMALTSDTLPGKPLTARLSNGLKLY
ncbi:hypothetical protein QNI19_37995 [Cytophagaceae bacterium DM2B3-1]|uniref:Uncharacterized protein n=1 Tax=Xanthocytophaga flava TaxID=3048013 RepID=A0ABT7CYD4_9BACT|nr:hypothetical protein [Xanthocytophaga flavus]MDJ1498784.1 hypothetical protein [Xanthocytophaga flavus]